jgi:hypothetical protein
MKWLRNYLEFIQIEEVFFALVEPICILVTVMHFSIHTNRTRGE